MNYSFFIGDKDTKICGAKNVKCYQSAEDKLFGQDIIDGLTDSDAKSYHQKCECLPSCATVEYNVQLDRAKLDFTHWMRSYKVTLDRIEEYVKFILLFFAVKIVFNGLFCLIRFEYSCIILSFDGSAVETKKRTALYTTIDFLSACGGLLGLFLGLSVFSLIQYIVNFMLCLYRVLRKKNDSNNIVAPFHRRISIDDNIIDSVNDLNNKDRVQWTFKY